MTCIHKPPFMVVFGSDRYEITVAEVEREDWPRVFVRRGGVAAFCTADTFWRLLDRGPVVAVFEDRVEGCAIIEAYAQARRRRLH